VVNLIFNNPFYQALFPYSDINPNYIIQSNSSLLPYQISQSSIDNCLVDNDGTARDDKGLESLLKPDDPLERLIGSKRESLTDSAKGLLEQIYERQAIRDKNFYEIDKRIGRANSIIETLDIFPLGSLPVVDKRKAIIEKELMGFEQERRFEEVACWRDISRLKTQLLEFKAQINSQANRERLLYG
jgi:hypothetical protein